MIDIILLATLFVSNLSFITLLILMNNRHAQTIDKLTSKIMAPDLNTYTVNSPLKIAPKTTNNNQVGNSPFQSIDTLSPEDGMRALAMSAGRLDEYEGAI